MREINDKEIGQVSGGTLTIVTNPAASGMPVAKPSPTFIRNIPGALSVNAPLLRTW